MTDESLPTTHNDPKSLERPVLPPESEDHPPESVNPDDMDETDDRSFAAGALEATQEFPADEANGQPEPEEQTRAEAAAMSSQEETFATEEANEAAVGDFVETAAPENNAPENTLADSSVADAGFADVETNLAAEPPQHDPDIQEGADADLEPERPPEEASEDGNLAEEPLSPTDEVLGGAFQEAPASAADTFPDDEEMSEEAETETQPTHLEEVEADAEELDTAEAEFHEPDTLETFAAEQEEDAVVTPAAEPEEAVEEEPASVNPNMKWYVVKVQSGREESIKEAIERRVKIEGLEDYYGQIVIPTEKETVIQKGKRIVRERKKFPGYIAALVEYNDEVLYLFRETSGVGDFVGGGPDKPPIPMTDKEAKAFVGEDQAGETAEPVQDSPFHVGDHVKVKDGMFKDLDGEVKEVMQDKGQVRVEVVVLGRPVNVELEYWQVEEWTASEREG